jgi:nucleotide-binding universal stress UspA family protein
MPDRLLRKRGAGRAGSRATGQALGAELILAHVGTDATLWREGIYTPEMRTLIEGQHKWAAESLSARAAALAVEGVTTRAVVKAGVAWEEIVCLATEEHADMIVIGTQGRTGLERLILGSVAERVLRHAPCPVLTVRPDIDSKE